MKPYDPIRKKFADFNIEVDKNKLWEKTSFAIPQKKKRRVLPILLISGLSLMISGYIVHITTNDSLRSKQITSIQYANESSIPDTLTGLNRISGQQKNETQPESNKENYVPKLFSQQKQDLRTSMLRNNDRTTSRNILINNFTSESISHASIETSMSSSYSQSHDFNDQKDLEITSNHAMEGQSMTEAVKNRIYSGRPLEFIEILPIQILELPSENKSLSDINYHDIKPSKTKKHFSFSIMQGIGFTSIRLTTTDPELIPVRDKWQSNIRSLEVISTSVQGSMHLGKRLQVCLGAQYSQLTSQLDYTHSLIERNTGEGTTTIIIDENGNQQSITGSIGINKETRIHSTRFTYQKLADLETSIALSLYHQKRLNISSWIKGSLNLLYASHGSAFNANDEVIKFTTTDNAYSLPSPFHYGAGLSSAFHMNQHWMLMHKISYERISFRHQFFENNLKSNYNMLSFSLGIGYYL